jgi:hypothetical protein
MGVYIYIVKPRLFCKQMHARDTGGANCSAAFKRMAATCMQDGYCKLVDQAITIGSAPPHDKATNKVFKKAAFNSILAERGIKIRKRLTIRSAEKEEEGTAAAPAIIDHVQPAADRIRTALAHKHLQAAPPPLESH